MYATADPVLAGHTDSFFPDNAGAVFFVPPPWSAFLWPDFQNIWLRHHGRYVFWHSGRFYEVRDY